MLMPQRPLPYSDTSTGTIHNYFERLVIEALDSRDLDVDADTYADIACVALNALPARYIRHDVDMAYFTTPVEYVALRKQVDLAIDAAIKRVFATTDVAAA